MFTATSLILLLLPLTLVSHKIAIVGGGIGGATNAHFLKQLLGESADIKVSVSILGYKFENLNKYT